MSQKLPDEHVNYSQENPLKGVFKMLFNVVLIILVFFTSASLLSSWLAPKISFKTEKKWFSNVFFPLQKEVVDPNEPSFIELNALVQSLASEAGFEKNDIQFYVTCDKINNAFAYPGGALVFNYGLLKTVKSENELAMIIGHELGILSIVII